MHTISYFDFISIRIENCTQCRAIGNYRQSSVLRRITYVHSKLKKGK